MPNTSLASWSVCIYDRAHSAIQEAQPSDLEWDAIFEGSTPAVVKGGMALPQRNGNLLKAKPVGKLFGNALVALPVDLSGIDVSWLAETDRDASSGKARRDSLLSVK